MVDAIVRLAVQKLNEFLSDKVGVLQGVREDVEWLKEELGWMQSFLKDAEAANRDGDNRVQKWIADISNIASETVDVLERFSLKVEGSEAPKGSRIMDRLKAYCKIPSKTKHLYNIGTEIKSLREKLQDISRRTKDYGTRNFGDGGEGTIAAGCSNNRLMMMKKPLRRTTSYMHEAHLVVGFEDEANKLLAELLKEERRRLIVSICGMGGLGKTTLAQKLYNSHEVRGKFNCQAWVCVSQEYRTEDLLRSTIKSFKRPSTREEFKMIEKMTEEDLERHLHDFLKERQYLVVLDDVWDKEAWKILRRAFPDRSNGSRVIITTRKKDVAIAADDRTFVHELRFLSKEESWDLFSKKAFPGDDREAGCCWSPAKEKLGREMVGKCAGLPLAIIVLAGLILHKKQLKEWNKVKEHIWRHLRNDSIEISLLLSLSYDDLSSQMKPCFLYLGMFPEDYEIDAEKLMNMWIAEEFIPQEEGMLEDVAKEYLNELINRSLIQVTSREWRRVMRFKVHDLLRDLAVLKAREKNFFDIYDPLKYSAPRPQLLHCDRHAVHSHILNYFSLDHSNSRLRSLVFFNPDNEELETMHLKLVSKNFKSLRVLDLEKVGFRRRSRLPDMIGELIHLKFLCLSSTKISELPPSIGNLKCLQFLEACRFSHRVVLPDEICKLTQLRHISANLKGRLPVENLTSLQTLRNVDYKQWLEIDTVNLINLRYLEIQNVSKTTENATYSIESVTKLKSLEELSLESTNYRELPPLQPLSFCPHLLELSLGGRIEKLNELPRRLETLWLQCTYLEDDSMPTLERLPNLRTLCLLFGSYKGKKMVCTAGGFRQLEYLQLYGLEELEEWQVEEGAMPIIRTVKMEQCPKLKILPEKLKSVIIS